MNEKESKIVSMIIFLFFILVVVIYHNQKDNSLEKNKKYTIVEVLTADVFGKNQTKITYFLNGKTRKTYSKLLWKNERDSIIGTKCLIEYDSLNLDVSKIIFGYEIPENFSVPEDGWKEIPNNFKKK